VIYKVDSRGRTYGEHSRVHRPRIDRFLAAALGKLLGVPQPYPFGTTGQYAELQENRPIVVRYRCKRFCVRPSASGRYTGPAPPAASSRRLSPSANQLIEGEDGHGAAVYAGAIFRNDRIHRRARGETGSDGVQDAQPIKIKTFPSSSARVRPHGRPRQGRALPVGTPLSRLPPKA
jgi:hypothetical protein